MAVPKRKTSKSTKGMRRSHDSLKAPNLSACPQCGQKKNSHTICSSCGYYKGKVVVQTDTE